MEELYRQKKILIIGGTGTVGSQLLKQLLKYHPSVIRILSRDEYKQYELQHKYKNFNNVRYLIGDVRDNQRVIRAMEGIDYVFHAAAMKHVPACEYNPFEAVQTNVIGTQNVIQAAIECSVKKVLFTSTDKAISPSNTYGATKLTAEKLITAAEYQKGPKNTVFASVRFGNVMGSRGSVIPLFKKQILEEAKITITDLNMSRYMMTPSEAASLMLKANGESTGGEVFVLKMPVIRLRDLAEVIIEEMRKKYLIEDDIDIQQIGVRPGEKMWEQLMTPDEASIAIETNEMYIIPPFFRAPQGEKNCSIEKKCFTKKPQQYINKEMLRNWIIKENLL